MVRLHELRDESRLDADLRLWKQRRGLRVPVAAEAENRRRVPQRLGQVRQRRDPDASADEERPLDLEAEALSERTENRERVVSVERAQRTRPGADRIDKEPELVARHEAERHRTRQHTTGCLEHEELAGDSRVEPAALDPQQRVRPDLLVRDDLTPLASHRSVPEARATLPAARSRWRAQLRPHLRAS